MAVDPKVQRRFEIRPYTYVYRGAGAFGFELRDERNRWLGVFDSVDAAEAAAAEHGATVRKSWESAPDPSTPKPTAGAVTDSTAVTAPVPDSIYGRFPAPNRTQDGRRA